MFLAKRIKKSVETEDVALMSQDGHEMVALSQFDNLKRTAGDAVLLQHAFSSLMSSQ